jgi:hypothetical protein
MRKHLLLTVAVLLVSECFAWAKPVKLEYKFKSGEINRYKMVMTTDTIVNKQTYSSAMKAVAVMKYRVLSVSRDGSAKMKVALESMKFTIGGSTQDIAASQLPAAEIIMTKFGEIKLPSGKGSASSALMQNNPMMGGGMMSSVRFPSKPVNVGKAWSVALPEPMKGKASCRLVNTNSQVGKFRTAKLTTNMSGTLDMASMGGSLPGMSATKPIPMSGSFSSYISPANGKLIRTDGNLRMKMQAPVPSKSSPGKPASKPANVEMNIKMEMFLIP